MVCCQQIGMHRGKLIVLIVMAVLVAQWQCAAACAADLCGASLPPCHRQHNQSHERAPVSCPDQILTTATSLHALQTGVAVLPVLALAFHVSVSLPHVAPEPLDSSPPEIGNLSTIVLRI